jgi:indolepyruvate ferredoxin oxidoreductase
MLLLGFAYQLGYVPVSAAAIEAAIELNGAAVEMSRDAFRFGRLAAHDTNALERLIGRETRAAAKAETLEAIVAYRAEHLVAYQDRALADRFKARVAAIAELERGRAAGLHGLAEAVARGYFKLLAYKDEYEVARLYADPAFERALSEQFESRRKLAVHLSPPLLARRDRATGEPRKMRFGAWMFPLMRLLAKGKRLRGTRLDVFAYSAERTLERQMIVDYEALLDEIAARLSPTTHKTAVALAALALDIKGFGHVKRRNYSAAKAREAALLAELRNPPAALEAAEEPHGARRPAMRETASRMLSTELA